MKNDSYSRYIRSDMYKEFLSGTKKKVRPRYVHASVSRCLFSGECVCDTVQYCCWNVEYLLKGWQLINSVCCLEPFSEKEIEWELSSLRLLVQIPVLEKKYANLATGGMIARGG